MESLKEVLGNVGDSMSWRKTRKAVTTLLFLLSILVVVQIISELKEYRFIGQGQNPIVATINVSGIGEVFAIPDVGKVTFSVVSTAKTASAAQEASATDMNRIIEALEKAGVEEKDIKTSNYNLYPKYEYQRQVVNCVVAPCPPINRQVQVGFEVNQSVNVVIRDTEKAGELIATAGELGATNISSLRFEVEDMDEVREEARELAIADAKTKAKKLARDLDVRLVKIVNYNDNQGRGGFYDGAVATLEAFGGDTAVKVAPQLPVGETKVTSQISITYEIR